MVHLVDPRPGSCWCEVGFFADAEPFFGVESAPAAFSWCLPVPPATSRTSGPLSDVALSFAPESVPLPASPAGLVDVEAPPVESVAGDDLAAPESDEAAVSLVDFAVESCGIFGFAAAVAVPGSALASRRRTRRPS
jgi:hypothetical protein